MLTLGGTAYSGVVLEEQMDGNSTHTISITACSQPGVNVWAYKMHPKYELAQQVLNLTMPLTDGQEIGSDIDLYGATFSIGFENERTAVNLGLNAMYGDGDDISQAGGLDDDDSSRRSDATASEILVTLSTSYYF